MARSKKITGTGLQDPYRYSPGDGHTYTWDGHGEYATVWRHQGTVTGPQDGTVTRLQLQETGDVINMTGCARTATAFMDHVDRWRK